MNLIRRSLAIALLLLFFSSSNIKAQSPSFQWASSIGGGGLTTDVFGKCTTTDIYGNVYTAGEFYGSPDFDPGVGTSKLYCYLGRDVFITKSDSFGNLIWAKSFISEGYGYNNIKSLTVDSFGNVYSTGNFYDSRKFYFNHSRSGHVCIQA
jgi:hypothetical protein